MVALILGLLLCVGVAMVVVGLVAVPARREGRDVLTPRGEQVLTRVLEKNPEGSAASGAPAPAPGAAPGRAARRLTRRPAAAGTRGGPARRRTRRGFSGRIGDCEPTPGNHRHRRDRRDHRRRTRRGADAPRRTVDQGAAAEGAAARP